MKTSIARAAWHGLRNALLADALIALAIGLLVTLSDLGWM